MKEQNKPFFTQFLEGMDKEELNKTKAGMTMRFPSDTDSDDWPLV